jgi:glycosyltransferase involved in cell wall biosynthesis
MFFPRGGSAVVVRNLARFLPAVGWDVTIACASLGGPGGPSHAASFFSGLDVRSLDLTPAGEAADPLAADPPFHPSFEDRPGAPDLVFARLDDAAHERQVAAWARHLERAGAREADVLHLNHLTPVNEAAARVAPGVPTVGHLHGTELLMLAAIEHGPPPGWAYAEAWAERLRTWARRCDRLFVLSPDAVSRVPDLLGVEADRVVWAPNGFDPGRFDHRPPGARERVALWRRWLVDEPAGWDASGRPGTVAYAEDDLAAFAAGGPVLLYVGRFTEVKRIPLLIRAHARAREHFTVPAPLVLLGGHPGEWEGPHPLETIAETGARDVFLAGWHGHEDLPDALNAADLVVLASVHEQFGQVLVEGMACGLPAIAVDAHGPATIVEPARTGWLVPPDDEDALVEALVEAVNDPVRRREMGTTARAVARERYAWPSLATGVAEVYAAVAEGRPATGGGLGRLPDPATVGAPRSP